MPVKNSFLDMQKARELRAESPNGQVFIRCWVLKQRPGRELEKENAYNSQSAAGQARCRH